MPSPAGTPGTAAVLISLGAQHPGPARGEVNVIEGGVVGWPATLANLAVASPARPLRSLQDRATRQLQSSLRHHARSRNCVRLCLSATCVDDSEPDPHDVGWRAATGYQPTPPAARGLDAKPVERLVAASRPSKREARLTTCVSYPPIGLEGWAASDPDSPLIGSVAAFTVLRTAARTAAPP